MRGVMLQDWQWVAQVEYGNHPDSRIVISALDCPDILAALAKVHAHVRECWPYEIISLTQEKIKR